MPAFRAGDVKETPGALEQWGNGTTYNLESVLLANIKQGDYWNQTAHAVDTVEELVDVVYDK